MRVRLSPRASLGPNPSRPFFGSARYVSLVLIPSLLFSACDGGDDIVSPTTGTLEITTTTGGEGGSPGAAGGVEEYTVSLDGGAALPIGINATLILSGIAAGAHTVQLGGLPGGCTVGGENPRGVTVAAGDTSSVDFGITCVPPAGAIR